ncbi:transglycosylase SLT domain-containing protein [Carnimonas nigrificans]|uniref:transglycosylase SLT domain-containing protein n=1 Tax=Carnimonas nigrificans TaxID=64323 RepID=UPI0004707692|nr:transglycosylase SLT domain-containing protein [Carnimonas nigrificans]
MTVSASIAKRSAIFRRARHPRRTLLAAAISAALFAPLGSATIAHADTGDAAIEQALNSARQGSFDTSSAVSNHVLGAYIQYHQLRNQLPDIPATSISRFINANSDSPLSEWLRNFAQRAYGKAGNDAALLAISNGVPSATENQCYYYRALLTRDPQRAAAGGRELWEVGHSQPNACDPLFDTLRSRGEITASNDWARLMHAWQSGNSSLVNYVRKLIDAPNWQSAMATFDRVYANPAAVTTVPARLGPDSHAAGRLMTVAFHSLSRSDPRAALSAWRQLSSSQALNNEQRLAIQHDIAFNSMLKEVSDNRSWVDQTLPQLNDNALYELRIRTALAERDWRGVYRMVPKMPAEVRRSPRWQYWLGRAAEQLGERATANNAYRAAAEERDFWGFAAADRIHASYAMNDKSHPVSPARINQVAALPAVQRVAALYRIGEPGLAYSEWVYTLQRADHAKREAMAAYAIKQHWYALAVQGSITARALDSLAWRFPPAYLSQFQRWGNAHGTDPYMLMGIARRESAFNPSAQSPAGARGLMQLMPGTAQHISRVEGIPYSGVNSLKDPDTNIRFGASYITSMLERYNGNRIAAAAAYNAGPGRVDRWLANSNQPFDLFVESIPFRETRNYVLAVLDYRAVFESIAKGSSNGVSMLSPAERNGTYGPNLLAR